MMILHHATDRQPASVHALQFPRWSAAHR